MIALVGNDLVGDRDRRRGRLVDGDQLLDRFRQGLIDRRGVALVGALQRHRNDRAGLKIDGVLGLVRQMRAPVFHLRDAGIGIVRMCPVVIGALLLSLPIQTRQGRPRRRLDPRGLGQRRQKLVIALPGVAPYDAAHGRVRFERGRIDRQRFPFNQTRDSQTLKHPREHRPMGVQIDQSARPRYRRMIWRTLGQPQSEKRADQEEVVEVGEAT